MTSCSTFPTAEAEKWRAENEFSRPPFFCFWLIPTRSRQRALPQFRSWFDQRRFG